MPSEPQYKRIGLTLSDRITTGYYPEESRLPGCRELAAEFGVSYVTMSNALRELKRSGLVSAEPGRGVFVRKPEAAPASGKIGLIVPTSGDLFNGFFTAMLREAELLGVTPVALTNEQLLNELTYSERCDRLRRYVADGYDTLIVEGSRHVPFRVLKELQPQLRSLNFVLHMESETAFPEANVFMPDYRRAGELAARHLFAGGAERIVLLTFEEFPEVERRMNGSRFDTYDCRILDGIQLVMEEAGMDFFRHCRVIRRANASEQEPEVVAALHREMKAARCGIMTVGDYYARLAYRAAQDAGCRIGVDCGVVGLYNTPWTQMMTPRLTSIAVGEENIARLAIRTAVQGGRGVSRLVPPELMMRES